MTTNVGARAARLAPLARSVRLQLGFAPGWLWWGATWSYLCGAAAALPIDPTVDAGARALAGWLAVVPLFGAFWTPVLAVSASEPGSVRRTPIGPALLFVAALAVAGAIEPLAAWVMAGGGAMLGARWLVRSTPPGPTGAVRSTLEVLVPAVVGWSLLGGPVAAPTAWAAAEGALWSAGQWLVANGPVLLVFASFTLVHHGATNALSKRDLTRRWWEIVVGFLTSMAVLALMGHAWAAAAVALLFVVSWPFHAAMRSGRVVWHLRHAQWLAMAAMLVAAAAV